MKNRTAPSASGTNKAHLSDGEDEIDVQPIGDDHKGKVVAQQQLTKEEIERR